jgi:23S rRNA pseudouridine955/2504/2580 synthase
MPIHEDRILFRDDSFLAVQKLSGELVVKGSGRIDRLPLLDFLRKEFPGLRPLQRLDFETSGVVLFARTKEAFEAAFPGKEGEIEDVPWRKAYRALVMGGMKKSSGDIALPLPARSGRGKVAAETKYRVLESFVRSTYVEAEIETGRHHQIRRHFAAIGHPLVLDHIYGDRRYNRVFTQEFGFRNFFLHAFSLAFTHPFTREDIVITAPLPKTFEGLLKKLHSL